MAELLGFKDIEVGGIYALAEPMLIGDSKGEDLPEGTRIKCVDKGGVIGQTSAYFELVDEKDKDVVDRCVGERNPLIEIDLENETSEFYLKVKAL